MLRSSLETDFSSIEEGDWVVMMNDEEYQVAKAHNNTFRVRGLAKTFDYLDAKGFYRDENSNFNEVLTNEYD